jgi:hypothetical protein
MSYISLDARQSQSIITGTQGNGSFVDVSVTPDGHLPIEIKGPVFPFGAVHTENRTILFQADGIYGMNSGLLRSSTTGSGSVVNTNSLLTVNTGSSSGSRSEIESIAILRYRPGQGIVLLYTAKFTTGVANSFQGAGLSNEENAVYVGYNGSQFGIFYIKNGVREIETLTITTASTTNENVTVRLDGVAFSVAVTNSGSTVKTAYEISRGTYIGWDAEATGSTVRFIAKTSGDKGGTFSLTATTAVGSFAETKKGVDPETQFVAQQDFNGDKLDGTGAYQFTINPARLNIFSTGIQYLGGGVVYVDCEVTSPRGDVDMVRVHTFLNPNTLEIPNFNNAAFNFKLLTYSSGSTTPLSVSSASFQGGIAGNIYLQGNRFSYRNTITTVTAANFQVIFSVRNDQVFNTRKSQAVVNILSVGASVKHAQPVEILIFKNATLAGTPNFQAYSSISCTDWDTASTTATISDNSQILWSGQLGETGNFLFSFSDQIRIFPGDVISVVAKATTGTPAYVSASLNTREDI